jgi:hypothetical protein
MRLAKKLTFILPIIFLGCGNSWLTTQSRENTTSALFAKGQLEYDKGNFSKALEYFEKILKREPENEQTRIFVSYSLNGRANLSPFSLINNLTKISSTSAASGGTSSAVSITSITNIAGLTVDEKAQFLGKVPNTVTELRKTSRKFELLHKSWLEVCQLLPKASIERVVGTSLRLGNILEIQKCLGGKNANEKIKSSAVFAAVMQSLGIASGLYQVFLDADGDGNIDLVKSAETITSNIQSYKTQAETTTDIGSLNATLTLLNNAMSELATIGTRLQGELFEYTLAEFEIVSDLIATGLLNLPTKATESITKGIAKLNEAKEKAKSFTDNGTSQKTSGSNSKDKITAGSQNASQTIDKLVQKQEQQIATLSGEEKTNAMQKLATEKIKVCSNYSSLQSIYGLAANKPAACSGVSLLENNDETLSLQPILTQPSSLPLFDLNGNLENESWREGILEFAKEANKALYE